MRYSREKGAGMRDEPPLLQARTHVANVGLSLRFRIPIIFLSLYFIVPHIPSGLFFSIKLSSVSHQLAFHLFSQLKMDVAHLKPVLQLETVCFYLKVIQLVPKNLFAYAIFIPL